MSLSLERTQMFADLSTITQQVDQLSMYPDATLDITLPSGVLVERVESTGVDEGGRNHHLLTSIYYLEGLVVAHGVANAKSGAVLTIPTNATALEELTYLDIETGVNLALGASVLHNLVAGLSVVHPVSPPKKDWVDQILARYGDLMGYLHANS